ncbi:TonB-dependent receptor [Massilia sp. ST3]|uniref:TonB-dependent receptor n=1 Tax=Massilia sp. ST3 TaxID=2824903 RepID=UPI001B832BB9|nr:TonB-dependent receptor [Massilia sp. ST3]MBQ5945963.1 TonB-dependent receptor [Massilia sp. ST3]
MRHFNKTAIAVGVAHVCWMSAAFAQEAVPAKDPAVVTITGQRAALNSAQQLKKNADEVVDSIVAEDIGKLPDRSVTEVLQRVPGVTIDRQMSRGDPEHFSVEGSGVSVRGLTWVRSELNGRDSFSANGGRALNFEDVPPELMAGVDVYKNPSAEQIEGGISGLVNLRTALPFDIKGQRISGSVEGTYSELKKGKVNPSGSFLYSNRWKTGAGEFGALFNLASSESGTRTDAFQVEPYYPRNNLEAGRTVWVPKGAQWRTLEFERERQGLYGALQWKLDNSLKSHVTYFKSKYKMQWDEQAIFSQEGTPYDLQVTNGTYDAAGGLLTGVLTNPTNGGINFGDDVRTSTRDSDTTDLAWNIEWRPNDRWTFTSDLQYVKAKTSGFDSTVATGLKMPKEQVDLTGDVPRLIFDASDLAYLRDPKNYYWAFTMDHLDRSKADSKAWKGDAKFQFDHPVLRDIRFGARLSKRDATTVNSNPSYNWVPVSQTWQVGWNIPDLAYLSDPRFQAPTSLHSFNNFFGGDVSVPAVVFPDKSLAQGYPATYEQLHKFHDILCAEQTAIQGWGTCDPWKAAAFGGDNPAGTNDQSEKTKALYSQLRFEFDNLRFPIDGNVGVRYVKTDATSFGYTVFNPTFNPGGSPTGVPVPSIAPFAGRMDYENSYHNWLPSLNLRMKVSEKLQFRLAFGKAMSRPDFSQLQAYTTLSQGVTSTTADGVTNVTNVNHTGEASGNPMLRPITARNLDLTAEWYFAQAGSLTFAVFDKRLKDIIVKQLSTTTLNDSAGRPVDFTVTSPINGARGTARGAEFAYQQYFDRLPGWMSGFGVQANYTYVDSKRHLYTPVFSPYCSGGNSAANLNLNLNGCDVDGRTFGDLPLEYLSKNSYNFALLYDKGPWSARLAYSWRSKNLMGTNNNGTQGGDGLDTNPASPTFGQRNIAWGLPIWADDYGQLDGGVSYKFNDNIRLDFQAQNLTDSKYRQLMTQHIGDKGRAWFVTGPRYSVRLGMSF